MTESHLMKFNAIENYLDSDKTYLEKEREIKNIETKRIDKLKIRIQEIEKEKRVIQKSKLSEYIVSVQNLTSVLTKGLDADFIFTLIRNGYIEEDYIDYVSLFHEESITRSDFQFILNIKHRNQLDFTYKLLKIENVISKINDLDFESSSTLNFDLLTFLLMNESQYNIQLNGIFSTLKNESEISKKFISEFLECTSEVEKFIAIICTRWSGIWTYYSVDSNYPDEKAEELFKLIVLHAETESIANISNESDFKKRIQLDADFLTISDDTKKLKEIIDSLDIKFENLDLANSPKNMCDFIIANNHYSLNIQMTKSILRFNEQLDEEQFEKMNYTCIQDSGVKPLIGRVNKDLNNYVENVFIKLENNSNEEESVLLELLNKTSLSVKNGNKILKKINVKISNLISVKRSEFYSTLLSGSHIIANWSNMLEYFNYHNGEDDGDEEIVLELPDEILEFINDEENAYHLSEHKMPKLVQDERVFFKFSKLLWENGEIELSSYNLISKSTPWWHSDLNIENLSKDHLIALINNSVFSPTTKSFNRLQESHYELSILLVERYPSFFLKIEDFVLDEEDLSKILYSLKIDFESKIKFFDRTAETVTISNSSNLKWVADRLLEGGITFNSLSETVLRKTLICADITVVNRIALFLKSTYFGNEFSEDFLSHLKGNYSNINNKSMRASLADIRINRDLLDHLILNGFISSYVEKSKNKTLMVYPKMT